MEQQSERNFESVPIRFGDSQGVKFATGVVTSFVFHFFLGIIVILVLQNSADNANSANQVFSVTLESGVNLGGIGQAPTPGAKKVLTPDQNQDSQPPEEKAEKKTTPETAKEKQPEKSTPPPEEKPEKPLTQPSLVEDQEKILREKKLKEEKEKKLQEEKRKEELEKKEKEKEDKEKKRKEDEKKEIEREKAAKEKERVDRNKRLDEALKKVTNQYEGESTNAGGKGFGAGALGGKGMGGGTLTSIEKFAYQNELQRFVKSGWIWMGGTEKLVARVRVKILQSGQLQDVRIEQSSGNRNFDDSVIRAVNKASPVPPPPPGIYEDFKDVVFTFDSKEASAG